MIRIVLPALFFIFQNWITNDVSAQLLAKEGGLATGQQLVQFSNNTPRKFKVLSIGDRVPDIDFKLINYSSPSANLSDFKGKLIILDFWASWCYSCLHAIPKLNKLQEEFGTKLQLIYVNSQESTGDTKAKVLNVLEKYSADSQLQFPVSYEDDVALKLFPHQALPHYVWITPTGIVKAITSGDEVKSENIKAILENESVELDLPVKRDYFSNKLMEISIEGQPEIDENLTYYSVFKKGRIDGLDKVNTMRRIENPDGSGSVMRGISMRNVPYIDLLETVLAYSKNGLNGDLRKRLILSAIDHSQIIFDSSKIKKEVWEKDNLYTYELVLPEGEMKGFEDHIWRDINTYSGYRAHVEKRPIKCLSLTDTKNAKFDLSKMGRGPSTEIIDGICSIYNSSAESLVDVLDKNPQIRFPVINRTTKNIKFDISFDYDNFNINELRQKLYSLGLELKESVEQINVLVISKNNTLK
jgi:thiol-disulfide isomerase/thioredoxin